MNKGANKDAAERVGSSYLAALGPPISKPRLGDHTAKFLRALMLSTTTAFGLRLPILW